MGVQEVTVKQGHALVVLLLSILTATAGAVWQFGPYGLYGGALIGLLALTFVDIEKPEKKGGDTDG